MASSHLPFVPASAPTEDAGVPPSTRALEAAHAELRRAAVILEHDVPPAFDLGPLAQALEQAFVAIYDACDGRAERLAAVHTARGEVAQALSALAPAAGREPAFDPLRAHLERAAGHLAHADERLARLPPLGVPAPQELFASVDVPRLHVLVRPSIAPRLRYPRLPPTGRPPRPTAALPEPTTFQELRAAIAQMKTQAAEARLSPPEPALPPPVAAPENAPLPGFTREVPRAIDDVAFRQNRARECFEEVAMVGMQRAPLLGDPWRGSLILERRMLASIDALAASGATAVAHVPRLVADAPVKDPSHAFALAMVMGCLGGRDALGAAEHALLTSDRDEAFVEGFAAGLKLVPHDALPLALRSLLEEEDPGIRAMAIDVLGYRGLATPAELAAAAGDVPVVAARALVHLAMTPSPGLSALLQGLDGTADPALREAVWWAMALTGHPHTEARLTAALDGPEAGKAALILAIAGGEEDARRVTQRALSAPTRELLFAVGWTGNAWAIGQLVDLLETTDDDALAAAAAWALERLTGAGLWEEAEVEDEAIEVADPPEPDVGEPRVPKLARTLGDPRDLPPEPTPETVEQPSTDAARWRAWWMEKGAEYTMTTRYRRGHPYTPLVSLGELDTARVTPLERRWLHRELVIRTGAVVRFDPHDLVAVQEEAMRAWQPHAARSANMPGRWLRPARKTG
ncbi:hypothetical protein [Chondromyces apiculatus]|uniref:HEAT repeat protein n=1 Tax=Chondromyces apiculatus DSM 436 TaxID=1192034 RepID=A0A017STY4_9BACT|nr:hypothetical protein [Chondromyces apiculatus]EYF00237.1 Hypothetical protein CAP_1051 [Chondromyces apiculatus DSM 436]